MRTLFMALLVIALASPATPPAALQSDAGTWDGTGNSILNDCTLNVRALDSGDISGAQAIDAGFCAGYVRAIIEFDYLHQRAEDRDSITKSPLRHICAPSSATTGQAARIVVKWLRDNPDKLHMPAPVVVLAALRDAFPCK